ncbi:hypothetical protein [Variovorax paradoxus]|uniref:hypothetical protein n=1 Tax=Variovorax paradoxus TaxID=34073 RepID=UPI0012D3FF61|nr:hypothetical protein [Variovorax paradoxus]
MIHRGPQVTDQFDQVAVGATLEGSDGVTRRKLGAASPLGIALPNAASSRRPVLADQAQAPGGAFTPESLRDQVAETLKLLGRDPAEDSCKTSGGPRVLP